MSIDLSSRRLAGPRAATTRRGLLALAIGLAGVPDHASAAEPQPFHPADVTGDDIAWLRDCRAVWAQIESGAPAIVPPSVDADAYIDLHLAYPAPDASAGPPERLEPILCAFFLNATFGAGRYDLDPPVPCLDDAGAPTGTALSTVEVTTEHLTLLKHSLWNGPLMDGKRPYGNRTFYESDMADLLVGGAPGGDVHLSTADRRTYRRLHHAMLAVVQAYIQHARFAPGAYVVPRNGWSAPFRPLCQPALPQQVAAYQAFCAAHESPAASPVLDLSDPGALDRFMRASTGEFWAKAALFEPR